MAKGEAPQPFVLYTTKASIQDDKNSSSRRRAVVGAVISALCCAVAVIALASSSDSAPETALRQKVYEATGMKLAQLDPSDSQGLALPGTVVQLDKVKPLLDSKGTQNLAKVYASLDASKGVKGGKEITLKGVPTEVTITLPEDMTVSTASMKSRTSMLMPLNFQRAWGYRGLLGPDHWGDKKGWEVCRTGKAQSPIDVVPSKCLTGVKMTPLKWVCGGKPCEGDGKLPDKSPSKMMMAYTGQYLELTSFAGDGDPKMTVEGEEYTLKRIVFHTPSEHTLDGAYGDMEMQLIHESATGKTMAVAVLYLAGNGNVSPSWLTDLVSVVTPCHLSTETTDCLLSATPDHLTKDFSFQGIAMSLKPILDHFYRYTGSITTPPCTEGVTWNIVRHTAEMSQEDWTNLAALMGKNNRVRSPINGRTVYMQ